MKYFVCVLLLAVATAAPLEEKKQEKRGALGLGYGGLGYGGLSYGGLGYGHGLGYGYGLGHGVGYGYGLGHGVGYGYGLGHGLGYGYGLGHGLYGGGIAHAPIAAPVIAKTVVAPSHYGGYGSPWLGLGHGYIH